MKLSCFLAQISNELSSVGRGRSCSIYHSVARHVQLCSNNPGINLREVFTPAFLCRFEHYLLHEVGLCRNTSSSYMTALRAVFREAVNRGKLGARPDLFSCVFTGSDPTVKRAVDSDTIAAVSLADLSLHPRLLVTRDMFVLSFYLHGISFVDLVHLLKADVCGNLVVYRRQKTGGSVVVPINDVARRLLNQYASRCPSSPYALCLFDPNENGVKPRYDSVLRRHNRHLEVLSKLLNLPVTLTTHVSRHSWASIAYHSNVEMPAISESLGHSMESVTRVYLKSLADEHLWRANRIVAGVVDKAMRNLQIRQRKEYTDRKKKT